VPSPFPGMDPYLEAPHIWPDLHDALAAELRNDLNQTLPTPYYAREAGRLCRGPRPRILDRQSANGRTSYGS
jgi:hypothetical protein